MGEKGIKKEVKGRKREEGKLAGGGGRSMGKGMKKSKKREKEGAKVD